MMIEVRYFSWLREKLQKDGETIELPNAVAVGDGVGEIGELSNAVAVGDGVGGGVDKVAGKVDGQKSQTAAVQDILTLLIKRGGDYNILESNQAILRYALNYRLAKPTDIIKNGDEVAIFPPVTGG